MATDVTDIASKKAKDSAGEAGKMNSNGNGQSIEDLAAGEAGNPEDEEGQVLMDFGDHVNLSLKGKKPAESKLKIRTIQKDIKGQLGDQGDDEDYGFIVVGRLEEVTVKNSRDDQGRTRSKKRVHVLTPNEVIKIPAHLLEAITTQVVGED